jgi:hypothetical protein
MECGVQEVEDGRGIGNIEFAIGELSASNKEY